jgi:Reverse transcriptase (RNA-dependent DNA polymerase)
LASDPEAVVEWDLCAAAGETGEIPKPDGGVRKLGIPTVLDGLIQQAVMQVLQRRWDRTFSDLSYGFRPGRSSRQALEAAQKFCCRTSCWTSWTGSWSGAGFGLRGMRMIVMSTSVAGVLGTSDGKHQAVHHGAA